MMNKLPTYKISSRATTLWIVDERRKGKEGREGGGTDHSCD